MLRHAGSFAFMSRSIEARPGAERNCLDSAATEKRSHKSDCTAAVDPAKNL
jgi:hypothetical protein